MTRAAVTKWDNAAKFFDLAVRGEDERYGAAKVSLFAKARGKTLLVAAGTGLDFKFFRSGTDLTAIDFSAGMLEQARKKVGDFDGAMKLMQADVMDLGFDSKSFDTVITSCTFCSVPEPVKGFEELHRVLTDDGRLLMFEHVRSEIFLLGAMMDMMNPVNSKFGPNINRRTADNARNAGFKLVREYNIYLDMVKLFEAVKA